MWHGPNNGHWVMNDTPGSHGNDILSSQGVDIRIFVLNNYKNVFKI